MIGLLLKDLLSLKKSFPMIALILVVFGVVSVSARQEAGGAFSSMSVILPTVLVLNTFGYDETSKWNVYALALPVTRTGLVLARYLLVLLLNLAGAALALIPALLVSALNTESLLSIFAAAAAALVLCSVLLPLIFRFGVQGARIAIFAVCLLPTLIVFVGKQLGLPIHFSGSESAVMAAVWLSYPAALVLLAVSFLISRAVICRKDI